MSTSLVLIFISSILSLIYISLHLSFAYRFRQGRQRGQRRTYLESISRLLPRVLIIFWIGASANGLVVAARQPRCMPTTASHDLWRAGLSCMLYRSATGMAVAALITTCILFCSIEVSDRPFYASPHCIYRRRQDSSFGLTPSPSEPTCSPSPSSSSDSYEPDKTASGRALRRQSSDRAFWLQRQNSLSSRNAIYPPCLRQSRGLSKSAHSALRSASAPQVGMQQRHWPSHRSQRSLSTSTSNSTAANTRLPSVSEHTTSTSSVPTRAASSVSSSSTSSSSSASSSSPLSTMRRASQPDVPIIPNRFLSVSSSDSESNSTGTGSSQAPPHVQPQRLTYAWSPSLHHAPLSADPAIRALSTSKGSAGEDAFKGSAASESGTLLLRAIEPALTASDNSFSLRKAQLPQLSRRATGHWLFVRESPAVV